MFTPGACLVPLRILQACAGCAVVALLLGSPAPMTAVDAAGARAASLYALTLLTFAASPRMRRDDLAGAIAALACVAEAIHAQMTGRASALSILADLGGVLLAWAPIPIEQYRRMVRNDRYVPFGELARMDRRRWRLTTPRPASPSN